MNKLIVSKEYINNFSVATVKDYEGCPEALKMLVQRYGDEVAVLSKRKQDFVKLVIDDNKPHWAINFILNMMKEKYRLEFFEHYFESLIYLTGDKRLSLDCQKAFNIVQNNKVKDYQKNIDLLESIINQKKRFIAESKDESIMRRLYLHQFICESVLMLLRDQDRKLTRSLNSALSKVAQAYSVLDLDSSHNNKAEKELALSLLDYSGLFDE